MTDTSEFDLQLTESQESQKETVNTLIEEESFQPIVPDTPTTSRKSSVKSIVRSNSNVKPPPPPTNMPQSKVDELRERYNQLDRQAAAQSSLTKRNSSLRTSNSTTTSRRMEENVVNNSPPPPSDESDSGKSFNEIRAYFESGRKSLIRPLPAMHEQLHVDTSSNVKSPIPPPPPLQFYSRIPKTRTPSPGLNQLPTPPPLPLPLSADKINKSFTKNDSKLERPKSLATMSRNNETVPFRTRQLTLERTPRDRSVVNHRQQSSVEQQLHRSQSTRQPVPDKLVTYNAPLNDQVAPYTVFDDGVYVRSAIIYERIPSHGKNNSSRRHKYYRSDANYWLADNNSKHIETEDCVSNYEHVSRPIQPSSTSKPRQQSRSAQYPPSSSIRLPIMKDVSIQCNNRIDRNFRRKSRSQQRNIQRSWSVKSLSPPPFRTPWLSSLRLSSTRTLDRSPDDRGQFSASRQTQTPNWQRSLGDIRLTTPEQFDANCRREARARHEWMSRAERIGAERRRFHEVRGSWSPPERSNSPPTHLIPGNLEEPIEREIQANVRQSRIPTPVYVSCRRHARRVDQGVQVGRQFTDDSAIDSTPISGGEFDDKREYFETLIRANQRELTTYSPECYPHYQSRPVTPIRRYNSTYSLKGSDSSDWTNDSPRRNQHYPLPHYESNQQPPQVYSSDESDLAYGWTVNQPVDNHQPYHYRHTGTTMSYAKGLGDDSTFSRTMKHSFDHDYYAKSPSSMPKIAPDPGQKWGSNWGGDPMVVESTRSSLKVKSLPPGQSPKTDSGIERRAPYYTVPYSYLTPIKGPPLQPSFKHG